MEFFVLFLLDVDVSFTTMLSLIFGAVRIKQMKFSNFYFYKYGETI